MTNAAVVSGWAELPGAEKGLTASEALKILDDAIRAVGFNTPPPPDPYPTLRNALMSWSRNDKLPNQVVIGQKLASIRGRIFDGKTIESVPYQGTKRWKALSLDSRGVSGVCGVDSNPSRESCNDKRDECNTCNTTFSSNGANQPHEPNEPHEPPDDWHQSAKGLTPEQRERWPDLVARATDDLGPNPTHNERETVCRDTLKTVLFTVQAVGGQILR
jgi:hypothetical protein